MSNQLQQIKKRNIVGEKSQYNTFSLFLKYMKWHKPWRSEFRLTNINIQVSDISVPVYVK